MIEVGLATASMQYPGEYLSKTSTGIGPIIQMHCPENSTIVAIARGKL